MRPAMHAWIWRRCRHAFVVVLLAAARALHAQEIRGVVRDSASRKPIDGAAVSVVSAVDSTLATTRTDAGGAFTLSVATTPDRTHLRITKLGFTPRDVPFSGGAAPLEVALVPLPPMLDSVIVTANAGCRPGDNSPPVERLWRTMRSEVAAGLERVGADAKRRPTVVTNARWYYDYRTDSLTDTTQLLAFQAARRTLERFLRQSQAGAGLLGPSQQSSGSDDLLFGDAFAAHECLRLVSGNRAYEGEVAVEFDPPRGGDDALAVAGRWWSSAAGGHFRELEFKYVHSRAPDVETAHGWLEYAVDDDGAAADADWWMYDEPTARLAGEWRAGHRASSDGQHASAWTEWTPMTESIASPPVVRGTVVSSRSGKPLAGVRVALYLLGAVEQTAFEANPALLATTSTDAAGSFRFTDLEDKRYLVRVAESSRTGSGVTASGETTFALMTHSDWLELENFDGVPYHRGDQPRDAQDWGDRIHPYPPARARRLTIRVRESEPNRN